MKATRSIALVCLAATCGGCMTQYPNAAVPYAQRIDTVTLGAGDAQDVNTATQMIDPWPPYVANRRIPGNGPRMVGAVERYEGSSKAQGAAGASGTASAAPAGGAAPPLYPLSPITPSANQ